MAKIVQYRPVFLLILLAVGCGAYAQTSFKLRVVRVDSLNSSQADIFFKDNFPTLAARTTYIHQLSDLLLSQGYIAASVDSVSTDSSIATAFIYLGKKYTWKNLTIPQHEQAIIARSGVAAPSAKQTINPESIGLMKTSILTYLANNGYPFATVGIDSVMVDGNELSGKLFIDEKNLYYIDTLKINGNIKLSSDFIRQYLQLKEHDLYREDQLSAIDKQLRQLPYIQLTKPTTVTMLNTGAEVDLFLENRRNNQINMLIGFLPSDPQLGGKLLLTGEANLRLFNPFGNGELLGFNWQQLQRKSPRLDLSYARPYLFHTPFGVEGKFELYKRDSFYLNIKGELGLHYRVSPHKTISVSTIFYKTNVLNVDTQWVKAVKRLPDMIDLNSNLLSLGFQFNNTDYRFNPRKGNDLQLSAAFGKKKVRSNNSILQIKDTSFNYASLYDTVGANSYVIRGTIRAAHFVPLAKQATLKMTMDAGWFQSSHYFRNEVFQIGGFNLLRGFDEESILTNRYAVSSAEYRYLIAQNGYFFGFLDFGFAKNVFISQNHTYLGLGGGLAFETKTGIFNISYAVGKRNDLSFDLRQSKIHLGFISVF